MKLAVVGHVEWVSFAQVDGPLDPGAILHADTAWDEAAGGGGVAAVELARLGGACTLFTAVGHDAVGQGISAALAPHGVEVVAAVRPEAHRRGITLVDPTGERTIVVVGPAQAALGAEIGDRLAGYDAVYWCNGDAASVRAARQARVLVATARRLGQIQRAGVALDALVRSANDPGERYASGDLDPAPALVAATDGARGGGFHTPDREGTWQAVAPPGPEVDAYGAGDSFAAGLTFALAEGRSVDDSLSFAAERGAAAVIRRGAHGVA